MRVLGKSPAWQDAGGACSGYLVVGEGTCLLLDCGSGVFGKLRAVVDYGDVDAVVISHLHADHILDLVPFASGLTYAPRHQPVPVDGHPGTDEPPRPRLLAPPGGRDVFRRLCAAGGMSEEHIESALRARGVRPRRAGPSRRARHQLPAGPALPPDPGRISRRQRPAAHLQRRLLAQRRPVRLRAGHRSAAHRGHAPAPRARGPARPPDARGGRRARPPGGRAAARPHPHLRRAGRRLGPPRGRARLRRPGRGRRRRRRLPRSRSQAAGRFRRSISG